MNSNAKKIIEAFRREGIKVSAKGAKAMAHCPMHPTDTKLVTINSLPEGQISIDCPKGCDMSEILAAVGLQYNNQPRGWEPPAPKESERKVVLTRASDIKTEKLRWLQDGIIPLRTGTIFAGQGGEGKTTYSLHIGALLTRGELDGDLKGQPRDIIIIGPEDDWATTMTPRLKAAGADLDRVHKLTIATELNPDGESMPRFPLDVDRINDAISQVNAALVILDPAPTLMQGDAHKAQDVRDSYEPLMAVARERDMSIIFISHFNKGGGQTSQKITGSHAWRDLTRSFLAFASDPDTEKRIITQDKNNYGTSKGSYEFILESVQVPTDDGEMTDVARVNFLGESETTVNDIINRGIDEDTSGRDECVSWLLSFLDQEPFEKPRKDVVKAARGEGFSERTLNRAKTEAGVGHHQAGFPASSFWTHPRVAHAHSGGATGATGENTNVSPGQPSYATVAPPPDPWHNSGVTGLTRENTPENTSYASHATAGETENQPTLQWGVNPHRKEQAS